MGAYPDFIADRAFAESLGLMLDRVIEPTRRQVTLNGRTAMSIKDEVIKAQALIFLTTNPLLEKINFAWKGRDRFKVYPSAYRKDVADALKSRDLIIRTQQTIPGGASGAYNDRMDTLDFSHGFDLADYHSQATFVHECTHAHLDMQTFGLHSLEDEEAVAHIAEAVFLKAQQRKPRNPSSPVWLASQPIAKRVLAGTYWLENSDVGALLQELHKEPAYRGKMVVSNGFKRSLGDRVYRNF